MSKLNQQNIIPTHEQFMAYVNGNMASEDKISFESAMQSDAFLAEALEGYQQKADWIGSITANVNAGIQSKYPTGNAGNMKYIYMSVAALLVVVLSIVWFNLPEKANENIAETDQAVQPNADQEGKEKVIVNSTENSNEDQEFYENDNKEDFVTEDELKSGNHTNSNEAFVEDENLNENFEDDYKEEIVVNLNKKKTDPKIEEKNAVLGQARLAVLNVAIGIKEHPMLDTKQKTKIVDGQVVTVDKTKNNPNYNQDDLPSYYGGDDALLAEIKGSIKPVTVQLDSKYDRVIGFDFEVGSDGKVDAKTLNFKGNPYPQIKTQIETMIKNFPMFIPGKASGKKGRIRYGIMLKY
ncbi:MAG: hypothetical protein KDC84_05260 [Crocinitomicaceae bacterium]|nr:hypothetical protein [Crocinitomicaceae bacterium]